MSVRPRYQVDKSGAHFKGANVNRISSVLGAGMSFRSGEARNADNMDIFCMRTGVKVGPALEVARTASTKRLNREYELLITESKLPDNVSVTWTEWNSNDALMLPFQWTFNVADRFDIVVRFPIQYPFKAPFYYVKTPTGVPVDVKQFLHMSVMTDGPDARVVKPGYESAKEYISTYAMMNFLGNVNYSLASTVNDYIYRLINDEIIMPLLREA